jgi:DNA-binding CsgD family transcriptional regulator
MAKGFDFSTLPVVGRDHIRARLQDGLLSALAGTGRTILLTGDRGTGKTHLCRHLQAEATRQGFSVASGRAYKAESGVPYALFSDAFLPILRAQTPDSLTVLSRGGTRELGQLFPGLIPSRHEDPKPEPESPGDLRLRLLWTFTEVLGGLAAREPFCIILEDLQWADPTSLEAVHFLARHLKDHPILLVLSQDTQESGGPDETTDERNHGEVRRSLLVQGVAEELRLEPFTIEETSELLQEAFGVKEGAADEFIRHVHGWTQGNPFFLQETLQALVQSGDLYQKGGAWLGWEVRDLELPRSVRAAILRRLGGLPPEARKLSELAAALGTRVSFDLLETLSPLEQGELLETLELLVRKKILLESTGATGVVYDFRQTLQREALLSEMGLARSRVLHRSIAETLESHYGGAALEHSDTLAYHVLEASDIKAVGDAAAATPSITYLARAGQDALEKFGNKEAERYLRATLTMMADAHEVQGVPRFEVVRGLARALTRLGNYVDAIPLWEAARELASEGGDFEAVGECSRRLGIILSFRGDPAAAVAEFDSVLSSPPGTVSDGLLARTRLRRGVALEEVGRVEEAQSDLEKVLDLAEELEDPIVLAQAHRALVLLHIWTGRPDRVRDHADRAMKLAKSSGARSVEFWTHWGLAVLEGLLGNTEVMAEELAEADRLARELRAPLLRLRVAELAIERASALGEWEKGIVIGEQAIALARVLQQNTILPRILVWTALIYLNRGEIELAEPLIEEAWEVSGAGAGGSPNVHGTIPAYIGRGYLAIAKEDYEGAVTVGREALQIAEKVGYGLWTVHRLIPLIAESYLWMRDMKGAREMGERLREGSSGIGHRLGLAWAQTCDALVTWLEGDPQEGARMMDEAAIALEEVPMIGDAARLRRMKAGRLADVGDRKGALEELNRVHEIFLELGAEKELEKTRGMFRELDARPPRRMAAREGALSHRELEIARLVEQRKSNKAIAKVLEISPRTVSTHLSNIYQKLEIGSRGELADYVRAEGLLES